MSHRARRRRITLSGQDVEHDVAPAQLGRQRLGAGRLDGIEPSLGGGRQDIDELPIAVAVAGEPAADLRQGRRQIPVAERVAIPERAGLPGQYRQVMPRVVGSLVTAEPAGVFADDLAGAPDNDPIGVTAQLRGAPRRLDRDAVAVVVEAHQAALRHRHLDLAEPVERAAVGDQAGLLGLEHLQCVVALLGMRALARLRQTARFQPGVQLGVIGKVQPRREQALARVADLVLDLAFSEPADGVQAVGPRGNASTSPESGG